MKKSIYAAALIMTALCLTACQGRGGTAQSTPGGGTAGGPESAAGMEQETTVAALGDGAEGSDSSLAETTAALNESETQEAQAGTVDLEKIHQAVKDAYGEQYIPSVPYSKQDLNDIFGIPSDLYDDFIAEGPMMSVHVDTFLVIHAKKGDGKKVEELLNKYRTGLIEDSMQYPMNMSKVEASQVIRHGDYVFFVMLGMPTMESQEQGQDAALESAKKENQKAIDAINGFFKG